MNDRDVFGDCALIGDGRWAGSYGVSGDFIARDNCRQKERRLEGRIEGPHCEIANGVV